MNLDATALIVLAGIIVPATVSIFIGFLTYRNSARKQDLDETVVQFNALKDLVQLLHEENDKLREQMDELQREIEEKDGSLEQLKAWAEMLVRELTKHDIPVPPMPNKENTKPRRK